MKNPDSYEFSDIERKPQFWVVWYWVNGLYLTHDKFDDYGDAVDFANDIGASIDYDPDYEPGICPACNGSRCNACKGKGETA